MAGKLYPPYIDGKVPAFCGTELVVTNTIYVL